MDSYNNCTSAHEEQDLTALLLKSLGVFDSRRLSELSGEALAAIAAGSCFCQPSRKAGGYRYEVRYPNGFAASIIKNFGSYGGEADLWEVAVLQKDEGGLWVITYDTDITDDVIGFQTEADVIALCNRIRAL
jgi:hypothetical protein